MKKGKLEKGLAKSAIVSCCALALSSGLFCCTSGELDVKGPVGSLQLSLGADTTGVRKGTVATKAAGVLDEFNDFLDEKEYRVQVYQGSDTLESVLYKDFPEKLEMKEGSYTLRAFKGSDLPAAFNNPYFEGSQEFAIKEGMKTPLDVTCKLANARISLAYSEAFRKVYTDCTVSLSTSYINDVFLVPQTETRAAYLQTGKEGTALDIAVSLKRPSWSEAQTYTVTDPAITLEPRESVTLVLDTDGKTGDGLALSIVLDDTMVELELEEGIPDFMWKPFDKPTVQAKGFVAGEIMQIAKGGLQTSPSVEFGVPAGIGGLYLWSTVEGSADTLKFDLATPEGMKAAAEAGFTLARAVDNLAGSRETNAILLTDAINRLERTADDKPYELLFFAKDNLPVTHYTDTLRLFVQVMPGKPTVTFTSTFPENGVVEGEPLPQDIVAGLTAEGGFEDVIVTLAGGVQEKTYSWSAGNLAEIGALLNIGADNMAATLTIPASFTESLDADAANDKEYTMTVTVNAERGLADAKSTAETGNVKVLVPQFALKMSDNYGDVFAKRAILRADLPVGNPTKLKFQRQDAGTWVDVDASARQAMEGTSVQVDTLKGLNPVSSYTIRAVYDNGRNRIGETYAFTTENVGTLPNGGFEYWSLNEGGIGATNEITGWGGKTQSPYRYWEIWYPWTTDSDSGWNTINEKTTQDGGTHEGRVTGLTGSFNWTRYVANSGTIRTTDKNSGNYAALVRSVGWGSGSKASSSEPNRADAGYLYLGKYNATAQAPDFGVDFHSRPTGVGFYCKYKPKNSADRFIAKIVILNSGNEVIQEAQLDASECGQADAYTFKRIDLNYVGNLEKAAKMYIVFQSGTRIDRNDTDFSYPGFGNLSNGEFVGSQLYIDDVELIYE